jgi:hypothetical protein
MQLANDTYEIKLLDPAKVRLFRSDRNVLEMEYEGERYAEVLVYRAFPLSRQEEYISIRTAKGDEIGIIERLQDLDAESLKEARIELQLRYLVPKITRIHKIRQLPGIWQWELETTLGPRKMSMRNLHDHMQFIGESRLIVSDLDGNRCEIPDIEALDPHSRKMLDKVL